MRGLTADVALMRQGGRHSDAKGCFKAYRSAGNRYTFNLTPEQNTGLGIWTEEMFVNAIRTGRHMGVSRPINPPMPWPAYRNASDDDLKAIYAYLRTITPIVNHVPTYEPPTELTQ